MAMDHTNKDFNPPMDPNMDKPGESTDLIDYFCPHCKEKLFRGKVTELKMVCPHCNTLVRSSGGQDLESAGEAEEK